MQRSAFVLGQTSTGKIITVVVLFLLASVFVYGKPEPVRSVKARSLEQVLEVVAGWKAGKHIPYDKEVVESLALDDYVNKIFVKGDDVVSLYIGYYLTTSKVGAAHDPLVCFPGQGWEISGKAKGELLVGEGRGSKIFYSSMMVDRGMDKSVILYWFQAYETANADTLMQKVTALLQNFTGSKGDNAFVRLTCQVSEKTELECLETMQDFTKAFYPVFLNYIRE